MPIASAITKSFLQNRKKFLLPKLAIPHIRFYHKTYFLPYWGGGIRKHFEKILAFIKQGLCWLRLLKSRKKKGTIALITRPSIQNCYGHIVSDLIVGYHQILTLAKKHNLQIDFFIFPQETPLQRELAQILGIQDRLIPSESRLTLQASQLLIPTLMSDYEIVQYGHYFKYKQNAYPPFLGEVFDAYAPKVRPFRKIFLMRLSSSNRSFANTQEVEEIFSDFGFELVLPDSLSLRQQIELFSQTLCIASAHGSGLMNAVFMQKNTFLFEIFPQHYTDACPLCVAVAKNIHYSYMIGKSPENQQNEMPWFENIYVDPKELRKALHILTDRIRSYGNME